MQTLREQMSACLESWGRRYAEASVVAYEAGLQRFEQYAVEVGIGKVSDVTDEVLLSFHSWLLGHDLASSTVNLWLRSVKLFLKWGYAEGLCLWDGSSYEMREPVCRSPEPPTVAVMQRLLELPNRGTPEGLRDLLGLELLYNLGLRLAECCSLKLESVDLNEETLFVRGKNGDERILPVGPGLKSVLSRYLFNARSHLLPEAKERALLLNDEGRPLPRPALHYIVRKYGERLDLKLSPHHLRHACATHLVAQGMTLPQVQRLLGHRDINSTQRYAQISRREMEREFHRCHPRSGGD